MKQNKTIFIVLVSIIILVLIGLLINSNVKSKTLNCELNNTLIDGFKNEEKIIVKFKKNKINYIDYKRTISLNEFYTELKTYNKALEKVLNNGYDYIDDFNLNVTDNQVSYEIELKDNGIILDNLKVYSNNDDDKTSLRYDINTDFNSEHVIKVGNKTTKKELTKELKTLGYVCK